MAYYLMTIRQGAEFNRLSHELSKDEARIDNDLVAELGYNPFITGNPLTKREKAVIMYFFAPLQARMKQLLATFTRISRVDKLSLLREGVRYLSEIGEEEGYAADISLTDGASYEAVRQWYIFRIDGKWYYKTNPDSASSRMITGTD